MVRVKRSDLSLHGARGLLRGAISGKRRMDVIDADMMALAEAFDAHPLQAGRPALLSLRRLRQGPHPGLGQHPSRVLFAGRLDDPRRHQLLEHRILAARFV